MTTDLSGFYEVLLDRQFGIQNLGGSAPGVTYVGTASGLASGIFHLVYPPKDFGWVIRVSYIGWGGTHISAMFFDQFNGFNPQDLFEGQANPATEKQLHIDLKLPRERWDTTGNRSGLTGYIQLKGADAGANWMNACAIAWLEKSKK